MPKCRRYSLRTCRSGKSAKRINALTIVWEARYLRARGTGRAFRWSCLDGPRSGLGSGTQRRTSVAVEWCGSLCHETSIWQGFAGLSRGGELSHDLAQIIVGMHKHQRQCAAHIAMHHTHTPSRSSRARWPWASLSRDIRNWPDRRGLFGRNRSHHVNRSQCLAAFPSTSPAIYWPRFDYNRIAHRFDGGAPRLGQHWYAPQIRSLTERPVGGQIKVVF